MYECASLVCVCVKCMRTCADAYTFAHTEAQGGQGALTRDPSLYSLEMGSLIDLEPSLQPANLSDPLSPLPTALDYSP